MLGYLANNLTDFPFEFLFRITEHVQRVLPGPELILEEFERTLAESIQRITYPTPFDILGRNVAQMSIKNFYVY